MKRLLFMCGLCCFVASAVGCGGATPEAQTPTSADANAPGTRGGQAGGTLAADGDPAAGVDLSPVAAPVAIVASLRWQNPSATANTFAGFAKMPQGFVDAQVRELLHEMVREGLDELVQPKPFAQVIAIDAPVDVIVGVDTKKAQPRPMIAAAIGLSSLRGALGAVKGHPELMQPGMWKLGPESSYGPRCVIAASGGRAPARLICGERSQHLELLAPYLARTLATAETTPVDLRLEISLRDLAKRYGPMLHSQARGLPILAEEFKLDIPAFDRALMETATAVAEEAGALINDLDTILFDVKLTPQVGLELAGKFQFAGKQSWLIQAAVDGADLAGPAPDIFWQVPKDSGTVAWWRSPDPNHSAKVFKTLQVMLQGGLQKIRFGTPADRAAVAKLLRVPIGKHVAVAGAGGHFRGQGSTPSASGGMLTDLIGDSMGWQIWGIEEGPTALRAYLQELVRTYNRPTLQQTLKKELGSDAQLLPKVRTVPAPRALGAGALAIEVAIPNIEDPFADLRADAPRAARPKKTTVKLYLLMMTDGVNRTWMGLGVNRDRLAKLMATTKGAQGPQSLAGRSDLSVFRRERHTSGGMTSLHTLIEAIKQGMTTAMQMGPGSAELQQVLAILERLPHQGRTPIVGLGRATAGRRPNTSFELTVPAGTLEDLGFLARNLIGLLK